MWKKIQLQFNKYIFTFFSSGIQSFVTILINKVLAIYSGPSGIYNYSQFQSFFGMIGTVGSGSMGKGIMSITSERYETNNSYLNSGIKSAVEIIFTFSLILAIVTSFFATNISKYIFSQESEYLIVYGISLNLLFYSLNSLYISLVNGAQKFHIFNILRIVQSITTLLFVLLGTIILGWRGAIMFTIVAHLNLFFLISFVYIPKIGLSLKEILKSTSNLEDRKLLLSFSTFSIISTIFLSVSQIYIRNVTANLLTVNIAGYFEGLIKITTSITSIFWGVFSVHYLPEIAKCLRFNELIFLLKSFILKMLVSTLILGIVLIIFGPFIIKLLYNRDFLIIENWIFPQLVSELIRVTAWCLGSVILAKKQILTFGILDIIFSVFHMYGCNFFIETFGIVGRIYLQNINYSLYSVVCIIIIYRNYKYDTTIS